MVEAANVHTQQAGIVLAVIHVTVMCFNGWNKDGNISKDIMVKDLFIHLVMFHLHKEMNDEQQ